ncbi:uncharacterized protein VP01_9046g1, partial [Puccinia sorghi]
LPHRQVESSSVASLMQNTVDEFLGIVDLSKLEGRSEIYNLLKKKCSQSDRRHKIDLMSNLLKLINDPTLAVMCRTSGSALNQMRFNSLR